MDEIIEKKLKRAKVTVLWSYYFTPEILRKLGANLPSASRLALTTTMAKHSKNATTKK